MSEPLIVTLPPGLDLWGGCVVRVTALDPATGATVSGVTVSNVTLEVDLLQGTPAEAQPPVGLTFASPSLSRPG